jgi:hypothetical protein
MSQTFLGGNPFGNMQFSTMQPPLPQCPAGISEKAVFFQNHMLETQPSSLQLPGKAFRTQPFTEASQLVSFIKSTRAVSRPQTIELDCSWCCAMGSMDPEVRVRVIRHKRGV